MVASFKVSCEFDGDTPLDPEEAREWEKDIERGLLKDGWRKCRVEYIPDGRDREVVND